MIRHTQALQRLFLKAITKAYCTMATKVLEVVFGIKPLWMEARLRNLLFNKVKQQESEENVEVKQLPHSARREDVTLS